LFLFEAPKTWASDSS